MDTVTTAALSASHLVGAAAMSEPNGDDHEPHLPPPTAQPEGWARKAAKATPHRAPIAVPARVLDVPGQLHRRATPKSNNYN
jgi:hypothetical protein